MVQKKQAQLVNAGRGALYKDHLMRAGRQVLEVAGDRFLIVFFSKQRDLGVHTVYELHMVWAF
jgi:hypothetical protein